MLRIEEDVDLGSGHKGNVGFGIVDNHNAVFIDTDQDNEFDYVYAFQASRLAQSKKTPYLCTVKNK